MRNPTAPLLVTLLAAMLLAGPAVADKKAAPTTVVTVYVNAHGSSTMTKKINEMHATMEAQGWRFADMEVHTENADTEGAWLTYTR